jgi:sec-independent protein translocase protein TatA
MGGLGFPEMVVILIIALVIFGPKKIPELGESLGKAIKGFKEGMRDEEKTKG